MVGLVSLRGYNAGPLCHLWQRLRTLAPPRSHACTAEMRAENTRSVLLADRHHRLNEGIRGLLETSFDVVVMVADELSLLTTIRRLMVDLVVMDLSLSRSSDGLALVQRLRKGFPGTKLIVLSVYDERAVCEAIL